MTQTISKQVDNIGRLVDEFSSFARMPEPEIKLDNLSQTLKESFDLFYILRSSSIILPGTTSPKSIF